MEYKMYGWGNDPLRVIPDLKSRGYSAVTGGYNESAVKACQACGMTYCASTNGFSAPQQPYVCCDGEVLANEVCVHDEKMRAAKLSSIKKLAVTEGIDTIIIDFCRYPSMVGGAKHFFGCFCPVCMEKMNAAGYDAQKIRDAVNHLYEASVNGTEFCDDPELIRQWLLWKEISITDHFRSLRDSVKEANSEIRFGAYVFAPSVAKLVGQNYEAMGEIADFLSPMLYRHWKHTAGDACLDKEVDGVCAIIGENKSIRKAFAYCGFDADCFPNREFLAENGTLVSHIVKETVLARKMTPKGKLVPIYLLEDPHIAHTIECVRYMCDEIDFFVYHDQHIDNIKIR